MPASILTPPQLVDEFKRSGEFDRIRRELLAQFHDGEASAAVLSRVQELVHQKLSSDPKMRYLPDTAATRELMQELDRYPVVERAVGDMPFFSDPSFGETVNKHITSILDQDRAPRSRIRPPPILTRLNKVDTISKDSNNRATRAANATAVPDSPGSDSMMLESPSSDV